MTGYLPLAEAAQYVTNKTGKECEPDALLRAGVHGALLIAAAFSGQMRNLTAHKNEDYSGLLTIHPRHLFEIETDGQATIVEALSLDGSACYAPHKIRTREQLRVLVSELDRFIPYIVEITPKHQAAPAGEPESSEIADFADIPGKLPNISVARLAILAAWQFECKTKRAASRDEVMAMLQKWATDGSHPETLIKAAKEKRAVEWNTMDMIPKIYDIEACGKALKTWIKSRA